MSQRDAGTGPQHGLAEQYVCPMHPEVTSHGPGDCPRCGMSLVPATRSGTGEHAPRVHDHSAPHGPSHTTSHAGEATGHVGAAPAPPASTGSSAPGQVRYTCPMHPQIIRDRPGRCPICGMHLEPMVPVADDDSAVREYRAMSRRFWISVPLSLLLVSIAALGFPELPPDTQPWVELALATPVVLWCAGQFFVWFADSIRHRSPNMWTLIGLGVGAAYTYSVVATLAPDVFPDALRDDEGMVGVYFEAAAVI